MAATQTNARTRDGSLAPILRLLLGVCVGAFLLWDPLDIAERDHLRRVTRQMTANVHGDLLAELTARLHADERLADKLEPRSDADQPPPLVTILYDHEPSDIAISWVDPSYRVVWNSTRRNQPREAVTGADEALAAVLRGSGSWPANGAVMSRTYPHEGRTLARRITRCVEENQDAGFLVVAFDVGTAFERILAEQRELGYSIAIEEGGREIFRTPGATLDNERSWAQKMELQLPGTVWQVRVWPEDRVIADVRSSLPELAMAVGGVLGVIVMWSLGYLRAARVSSRQLEEANDQLEERVEARTRELQQLSGVLLRLQDEERHRIARELHDSVGQTLTALSMNLEAAQHVPHGSEPAIASKLGDCQGLVGDLLDEIRTMSYLLHPPMLDDLGLAYVLPWYGSGFSKRSGIQVRVRVPPEGERMPRDIELTLFRVAQEALTNVHRHANSHLVEIELTRSAASATLTVRDDGHGFGAATLDQPHESAPMLGVGIAGMRERVRQFGGLLEIVSSTEGTCVLATIPLGGAPATDKESRASDGPSTAA